MTEEIDELDEIEVREEKANKKIREIISAALYFGSRAGICFLIYNAIIHACIAVNPILKYSQELHDHIGYLAIGIFLFLSINGTYLNSVNEK